MPTPRGTLEAIGTALGQVMTPLRDYFSPGEIRRLLSEMGMDFPQGLETQAAFINSIKSGGQAATQLPDLIKELAQAIKDENIGGIVSKGFALFNAVRNLTQQFIQIATSLQSAAAGLPGVDPVKLNNFVNALPGKLIEHLIVSNLESIPGLIQPLELLKIAERKFESPFGEELTRKSLNIQAFLDFIKSPATYLDATLDWGKSNFDGVKLLSQAQKVLANSGIPAVLDTTVTPNVLDLAFLEISATKNPLPPGLFIRIADKIKIDSGAPIKQDNWSLETRFKGEIAANAELTILSNGNVIIKPPTGTIEGDAKVIWTGGSETGTPYILIGQGGGPRIEARQLVVETGVGFAAGNGGQSEGVFKIGAQLKHGKIVISLEGADGFLGTLLSGFAVEADFDLGFGFSSKQGLYFYGSAVLEVQIPLHVNLGIFEINALSLGAGISPEGFPLTLGTNIKAPLGPLVALVEDMGIKAVMSLPPDRKGNVGPLDFKLAFKPPKGVGLSIDAGVIKGGGYLFIDVDKGEYAGALELVFSGFLSLKAIGLINTRMPDGSNGFSLLIIITAEFGAGIQLGFGFTLLGVGGLLGLNRTMKLDVLAQGVRTGSLNNILFPKDVIANAPKIISDLRAIFPPQNDRFLIGPMAKLGWGTPTLISLSLGIIIEIPGNIAILGVFRISLPTEAAPLVLLQVSFIGAIEFDKSRIWFFATLFGSRVLFFTIEGEMGLLMAFGNDPNFVLSVGGFHPRFTPPPLPFPSPRRVAFDIVNTPVYQIRVEGYFAVTSNTVQFGARADLRFGFDDFGISGHIAFDALFQFSPFHFILEISASVKLKAFGVGLFTIRLEFTLEGPEPWRAKGSGYLEILFFEISADFDVTWGEDRRETLPPIETLILLDTEIGKAENWTAAIPASTNLLVSLRKPGDLDGLVLHPLGTLKFTQRAIPIGIRLDKIGSQKVKDYKNYSFNDAGGASFGKVADPRENFTIAQFQDMSDSEKLSRPSYQMEKSGAELSVKGKSTRAGKMTKRTVRYETIIIDTNYKRFRIKLFAFVNALFTQMMRRNSVALSTLSTEHKRKLDPWNDPVAVRPEGYAVVTTHDNKAVTEHFFSETEARQYMNVQIAQNPKLSQTLDVVPGFEVNMN